MVVLGASLPARRRSRRRGVEVGPVKAEPYRTAGGEAAGGPGPSLARSGVPDFSTPSEPYRTAGGRAARGHRPDNFCRAATTRGQRLKYHDLHSLSEAAAGGKKD
jgi:hypothetical protein